MTMRSRVLVFSLAVFSWSAIAAESHQVAARLLDHLEAARMDDAEAMFTQQMARAVPAESLATLWSSLGALESRGMADISSYQDMQMVVVPLQFVGGRFDAQVLVDKHDKVAGLMLRPAATEKASPPPVGAGYSEVDFSVPQARGSLSGTLSLPDGKELFPALVLVHGSGPHDRDESIGPNRPFLDVARGLAAQGIAVLRYDKRTYARPQDFGADFTIDDETTDDAVAALAAVAADPRIDGRRVFVMGHSQGGMLAARIAKKWSSVRGAILWATPARTLLQLLPEQSRRVLTVDGQLSPEAQAQLDMLDTQIVSALGEPKVEASELPLGVPQSFWKSIEAVDARGDAKALEKPILLLHGGRDFQVTATDWQLWHEALDGQREVKLMEYSALNHLGIAGSGPASPHEYSQPGHVAPQLIEDVAHWVKAQQ